MKPVLLLMSCCASLAFAQQFDVVVYGGTAGGAIAAYSAAKEGLRTALVEPGSHIGGMVSGGLGFTDFGKKEVIGGYAYQFYVRVGRHYEMNRFGNEVAWYHEPHVAEQILRDMLREAGVTVFEHQRLREKNGVRKQGLRLAAMTTEAGQVFEAKVFMDATYEGDLMAQAGVTYAWGRESSQQYGESLAGVRDRTPLHQFLLDVPGKNSNGKLLPEVQTTSLPPAGSADKAVQAYNFRLCLSEVPSNQIAFTKPPNYDPQRYELLRRLIDARIRAEGQVPPINTLMKPDRIPNGKFDLNNNGAFSTDYIGGSWEYPEGSYAKRQEIWQAHKDYIAGLLYFLANDQSVPEGVRSQMNRFGLCRDEFQDTGNWPYQLYIREARRLVGEYVVVQKDLQTELTKPDPIGMGSYNSDSHNVQRYLDDRGFARNEGDMQVAVKPYQIPLRVMMPKRAEITNLLVPVCFSASHVAYSSLRMEPQYMIIGQAAGVVARLAVTSGKPVQEVNASEVTANVVEHGAILEYVPSPQIRRVGIRQ